MIQSYTNLLGDFLELRAKEPDTPLEALLLDITDCILASHYCSSRSYKSSMGMAVMTNRIYSQVNVVAIGLHIATPGRYTELIKQYIENYLTINNVRK